MRTIPLLFIALTGCVAWADPEGLPVPASPRTMSFAEPKQKALANGMQVIAVDRPGLPVATVGLLIRSGAESDPAKLSGLAQFTGSLLMRGTTKRTATQLAQDLEGLGASAKVEATWDQTVATLTTLSSQASPSLEILAELMRQPAFAPAEIDRLKKEAIDELTVTLEQPGQLARLAAARSILQTQPYAHSSAGTPASLARIKRADIAAFHARHYRPDQSVLIVAGDLRADDVFALAEKWFGDWNATDSESAKAVESGKPAAGGAILIDLPSAGQAAVYVGSAVPARRAGDFEIGQVANGVLGGGFSARLNREVRIKRGLSYGCRSRLSAWRGAGLFGAGAQTKNESAVEVVKVIREELGKLGADAVPDDEFTARRAVLTGEFQRELETNEGYVQRIIDFLVHGEKPDSFAETLARIGKVTPADAQAFAKSHFNPDNTSIVVVGRAKVCEKSLRELLPNLRVIPHSKVDLDLPALSPSGKSAK